MEGAGHSATVDQRYKSNMGKKKKTFEKPANVLRTGEFVANNSAYSVDLIESLNLILNPNLTYLERLRLFSFMFMFCWDFMELL